MRCGPPGACMHGPAGLHVAPACQRPRGVRDRMRLLLLLLVVVSNRWRRDGRWSHEKHVGRQGWDLLVAASGRRRWR